MFAPLHSESSSKSSSEPLLEKVNDDNKQVQYAIATDDDHSMKKSCYGVLEAEEDNDCKSGMDCCGLWFVLPLLLFLQFGMALSMDTPESKDLNWSTVIYNIGLFTLTSHMFRRTLQDLEVNNILLALAPEILMDVILGLIWLDHVMLAFRVLLVSALCLALFVVCGSLYTLYTFYWPVKDVSSDNSHQDEDDKLADDVSRGFP